MNWNDNETADCINDVDLDRLVDGELSEAGRREMLLKLDSAGSGGWRRCALAFLEAQCWRETVTAPLDGNDAVLADAAVATPWRLRWPKRAETLLAMAASFLIALSVGSWALRSGVSQRPVAGGLDEVASTTAHQPTDTSPCKLVTVSLASNDKEPAPAIDVPAVERDRIDKQWLRDLPSAIPDNVVAALNRTGHQIEQRREMVPIPLEDGRQLVVPVDQVEVRYVGTGVYY